MLRDKKFKMIYSTDRNNIQDEFYVPALMEAKSYKRVSGYFSSAALSLFSKGLYGLYKNKGKYYLLISNVISDKDFKLIKNGYLNKNNFTSEIRSKLSDFSELSYEQKMNFSNLAYLIEIGLVEIKIGFTKEGIFHAKYGIINDGTDYLFFSGSLNETQSAFIHNYESIIVNKSWQSDTDRESIIQCETNFNKLWNNLLDDDMITVREANDVLRDELISYSKGKFISNNTDSYPKKNIIILKYDNGLVMDNRYNNFSFSYDNYYMRMIKDEYLKSKNDWTFYDDLTFEDIKLISDTLSSYANDNHLNFKIDKSLYNYLDSYRDFPISKIKETGTLIKNQDLSIIDEFNKFKTVVSNEMERKLRDKQMWSSFYMNSMKRVGNFSVPGSGKTSMVYGAFAYMRAINGVNKIVVVCPKSAFKSWKDEYVANFGPNSPLSVYDVQSSMNQKIMSSNEYNLYLYNYESTPKYEEEILKKVLDKKTLIVFDEAHRIKSADSVRAKICIEMSEKVDYCFVLTGTPIPNNYSDIWNFMHILYDKEYNKVFGFDYGLLGKAKDDSDYAKKVNEKLYPFFWRTNKKQLGVPDANDDHIYKCVASPDELKIASYLWKKYRDNPIVLFVRLTQLSSNPELLYERISSHDEFTKELENDYDYNEAIENNDSIDKFDMSSLPRIKYSTKYQKTMKIAKQLLLENKKIIIWCLYRDTMKKVCDSINKLGYNAQEISGKIDDLSERDSIIDQFKNGNVDVIVSNPQTIGESVSLHDVCHDALYLEYSFNLTHMLQSRDRIHRLGLKPGDQTNYYYFLSEGNYSSNGYIDEKIYDRLKEKENLMKKAVDETKLSIDFSFDTKKEIIKIIDNN